MQGQKHAAISSAPLLPRTIVRAEGGAFLRSWQGRHLPPLPPLPLWLSCIPPSHLSFWLGPNPSVFTRPLHSMADKLYHKACSKCSTCNGQLTIENFATSGDRLLCKTHFMEEFAASGGKYAGDNKYRRSSTAGRDQCDGGGSSGGGGGGGDGGRGGSSSDAAAKLTHHPAAFVATTPHRPFPKNAKAAAIAAAPRRSSPRSGEKSTANVGSNAAPPPAFGGARDRINTLDGIRPRSNTLDKNRAESDEVEVDADRGAGAELQHVLTRRRAKSQSDAKKAAGTVVEKKNANGSRAFNGNAGVEEDQEEDSSEVSESEMTELTSSEDGDVYDCEFCEVESFLSHDECAEHEKRCSKNPSAGSAVAAAAQLFDRFRVKAQEARTPTPKRQARLVADAWTWAENTAQMLEDGHPDAPAKTGIIVTLQASKHVDDVFLAAHGMGRDTDLKRIKKKTNLKMLAEVLRAYAGHVRRAKELDTKATLLLRTEEITASTPGKRGNDSKESVDMKVAGNGVAAEDDVTQVVDEGEGKDIDGGGSSLMAGMMDPLAALQASARAARRLLKRTSINTLARLSSRLDFSGSEADDGEKEGKGPNNEAVAKRGAGGEDMVHTATVIRDATVVQERAEKTKASVDGTGRLGINEGKQTRRRVPSVTAAAPRSSPRSGEKSTVNVGSNAPPPRAFGEASDLINTLDGIRPRSNTLDKNRAESDEVDADRGAGAELQHVLTRRRAKSRSDAKKAAGTVVESSGPVKAGKPEIPPQDAGAGSELQHILTRRRTKSRADAQQTTHRSSPGSPVSTPRRAGEKERGRGIRITGGSSRDAEAGPEQQQSPGQRRAKTRPGMPRSSPRSLPQADNKEQDVASAALNKQQQQQQQQQQEQRAAVQRWPAPDASLTSRSASSGTTIPIATRPPNGGGELLKRRPFGGSPLTPPFQRRRAKSRSTPVKETSLVSLRAPQSAPQSTNTTRTITLSSGRGSGKGEGVREQQPDGAGATREMTSLRGAQRRGMSRQDEAAEAILFLQGLRREEDQKRNEQEAKSLEFSVVLPTGKNIGIGLTHNDTHVAHGRIGCKVTRCVEGGHAAISGKIIQHDWIIAVNGKNVSHDNKKSVIKALKAAFSEGSFVTLRFSREEESEAARAAAEKTTMAEVTAAVVRTQREAKSLELEAAAAEKRTEREAQGLEFTVVLPTSGNMGMGLTHNDTHVAHGRIGCKVTRCVEGGHAAATGAIIPHDWIIAVNGKDVSHDSKRGVIAVLKAAFGAGDFATLRFSREEENEAARAAAEKAGAVEAEVTVLQAFLAQTADAEKKATAKKAAAMDAAARARKRWLLLSAGVDQEVWGGNFV